MRVGATVGVVLAVLVAVVLSIVLPLVLMRHNLPKWTEAEKEQVCGRDYGTANCNCAVNNFQKLYTYNQFAKYRSTTITDISQLTDDYCKFMSTFVGVVSKCVGDTSMVSATMHDLCSKASSLCQSCTAAEEDVSIKCVTDACASDWKTMKKLLVYIYSIPINKLAAASSFVADVKSKGCLVCS